MILEWLEDSPDWHKWWGDGPGMDRFKMEWWLMVDGLVFELGICRVSSTFNTCWTDYPLIHDFRQASLLLIIFNCIEGPRKKSKSSTASRCLRTGCGHPTISYEAQKDMEITPIQTTNFQNQRHVFLGVACSPGKWRLHSKAVLSPTRSAKGCRPTAGVAKSECTGSASHGQLHLWWHDPWPMVMGEGLACAMPYIQGRYEAMGGLTVFFSLNFGNKDCKWWR